MPEIVPLNEEQMADVRAGIAQRKVWIVFGPEPHWYELQAKPNEPQESGTWTLDICVYGRRMKKVIEEAVVETEVVQALGVAIGIMQETARKSLN
jgi:hypothetical protein